MSQTTPSAILIMVFDELYALHEHVGRAAARIEDSPILRRELLDQHTDHAAMSVVELFKYIGASPAFRRLHRCGLAGEFGSEFFDRREAAAPVLGRDSER